MRYAETFRLKLRLFVTLLRINLLHLILCFAIKNKVLRRTGYCSKADDALNELKNSLTELTRELIMTQLAA